MMPHAPVPKGQTGHLYARTMSGMVRLLALGTVAGAAAWGGLSAGERGITVGALHDAAVTQLSMLMGREAAAMPNPEPTGAVLSWRHPDGVPEWSGREAVTADGRVFLAVRASEDISLDPAAAPAPMEGSERTILHYRNPMDLPDTSPVPKLDSMGMDCIAVYAGEGSDDGSITVSPGKLQRTGVRTTEAVLAPLATSMRAPGIVVPDARKVSVIS